MQIASEILINARQVTRNLGGDIYEFILNAQLEVVDCIKVIAPIRPAIRSVTENPKHIAGILFELQHVRVNPRHDNRGIIDGFIQALSAIGVAVANPPSQDMMEVCFKPLGEIKAKVRFYLTHEGQVVFLSPNTRPKLVNINEEK